MTAGRSNWAPGSGGTGGGSGRDGAREPAGPGVTAAGSTQAFRLESLRIQGGAIHYRDSAKGTVRSVRDLSADVAMDSLAGPFRVKGEMTAQGLPLTFGGNVGRYVEGTPLAFALDLGLPGASAVSAKGVVTGLGDVPALTADIRGEGPQPARLDRVAAGTARRPGRSMRLIIPSLSRRPWPPPGRRSG